MRRGFFRAAALALCLALAVQPALGAEAEPILGDAPLTMVKAPVVWGYSEGLALCERDGKWGYVNVAGEQVIPIQYDSAVSFSLGLARVSLNGKLGVIRTDGTYLIPPEYDTLRPLDYGLYIVQKGVRWGVVSILPFPDGAGGQTNALYPVEYDSVTLTELGGVQRLRLQKGSESVTVPLYRLPSILLSRGVPGALFPLTNGRTAVFADVSPRDWYAVWVDLAYNSRLMEGVGNGLFAPLNTLTVAEALRMAACLESRALRDDFHLQSQTGPVWYSSSVAYCEASGIISPGQFSQSDYGRPITRAEMAVILAKVTPARSMEVINDLDRVRQCVPDVSGTDPAASAIYSLYAKGVFRGTDSAFSFCPDSSMTRAEAAAVVSRIARPEQRVTFW